MNDPRSIIKDRALGILRDIPDLRDVPTLEDPFSDITLDPLDRWMIISKSDSLAMGGFFRFFPTLSSATPYVIGEMGKVIGVWNLFDGVRFGEKRIPLVKMTVRGKSHWNDDGVLEMSCSVQASNLPPMSSDPQECSKEIGERASFLCDDVAVWSVDDVGRFCVIAREKEMSHSEIRATFHDDLMAVAIRICRSPMGIVGIHDLENDRWHSDMDVSIDASVSVEDVVGRFSWERSMRENIIMLNEETSS